MVETVQATGISDVFISYAREDKSFAQRLHDALASKGRQCWVDWEDIPLSADWLQEVRTGIESAENFVFVISPDSLRSGPCSQEVIHAVEHGKRIVPIVRRKPDDEDVKRMHPKLSAHNWVFFDKDEDFEHAFENLNTALDTDLDYVRAHTRLLMRARDWSDGGNNPSLLLRGDDLRHAETWLANAGEKEPLPTERQRQYILASRKAANAALRTRVLGIAIIAVFAVLTAFALYEASVANQQSQVARANQQAAEDAQRIAVAERDQSVQNAARAHSLSLASSSLVALADGDNDLALALAIAANRDQSSLEAERALASVAYAPGTRMLLGAVDGPHGGIPNVVRFAPDGQTALSSACGKFDGDQCTEGEIILWDMQTRQEIRRFHGHTDEVWDAVFSLDGQQILSGGLDGLMILWDANTGQEIREFKGHSDSILSVAFSPDGKSALSASNDKTLILWNLDTGEKVRQFEGHTDIVTSVAFSPDGTQAISASNDQTLILWDIQTGMMVRQFRGHEGPVNNVIFSPDGRTMLSASNDFSIRLWDVKTGVELHHYGQGSLGHTDWVTSVAFSADGKRFVSGSYDNSIILWDVEHETVLQKFLVHTAAVTWVDLSPDDQTVLSAQTDGTLRIWNLQNGAEYQRFSIQEPTTDSTSATFNSDGSQIYALQADGSIGVWDVNTGAQVNTIQVGGEPASSFTLNPVENTAASVLDNGAVVLWDVETGDILREMKSEVDTTFEPSALAFSADGHYLLGGGEDLRLHLWNADTGEEERVFSEGHVDTILGVAFSPDGTKAASGSSDQNVMVWDVKTGSVIHTLEGNGDYVQGVTFSPDGKYLLSTSWDNSMRLWDVESGEELQDFIGHSGGVIAAQFNADGSQIISGSTDGSVRVWDTQRGLEVRRFDGWNQPVQSVGFSPDGKLAFSTSRDNVLRVWHIHTLDELLAWIPDHRYIRDFTCDERETYNIQPLCDQMAAFVVVDTANVWERADENSSVLSEVYQGEDFPVLQTRIVGAKTWYQIEMPSGQRGWIHGDFVKIDEPIKKS